MRRLRALLGLAALTCAMAAAQSTTLSGTVTDTMCGAKHMMTNVSPQQCARECIKQGSDYGLVSGDNVYTLKGDKAQFDHLLGQTVTVNGKLSGKTMNVDSITPEKSK